MISTLYDIKKDIDCNNGYRFDARWRGRHDLFDEDNDGHLLDGDKDECHSLPSKGFVCVYVCCSVYMYILLMK